MKIHWNSSGLIIVNAKKNANIHILLNPHVDTVVTVPIGDYNRLAMFERNHLAVGSSSPICLAPWLVLGSQQGYTNLKLGPELG